MEGLKSFKFFHWLSRFWVLQELRLCEVRLTNGAQEALNLTKNGAGKMELRLMDEMP